MDFASCNLNQNSNQNMTPNAEFDQKSNCKKRSNEVIIIEISIIEYKIIENILLSNLFRYLTSFVSNIFRKTMAVEYILRSEAF